MYLKYKKKNTTAHDSFSKVEPGPADTLAMSIHCRHKHKARINKNLSQATLPDSPDAAQTPVLWR